MSGPVDVLAVGDGVEVISGPHKGREGVVEVDSQDWPTVRFDRMGGGQGFTAQVRRDQLALTERAATSKATGENP